MGREIRRVPADWEHPRNDKGKFIPLFDEDYETAAIEWVANFELWQVGKHEAQPCKYCKFFWEYDSPPDQQAYRKRKWTEAEATHYQVYETVSEGTPITPRFASKEELVNWLCTHKDYWDDGPLSRIQAEAFVKDEWVPSMVITEDRQILQGMEISAGLPKVAAKQ